MKNPLISSSMQTAKNRIKHENIFLGVAQFHLSAFNHLPQEIVEYNFMHCGKQKLYLENDFKKGESVIVTLNYQCNLRFTLYD